MVRQTDRAFGLMFAGVFAIITAVGWFVFDARINWAGYAAAGFLLIALIKPIILLPLNRLWMGFAHFLSGISNRLVLGLFFFIFMTTFGLVMKMSGRDPMTRNKKPGTSTYWRPVKRQVDRDTLIDMF